MTIRRRATVLGAAVLSLAALSACGTKPTPITSVGAGTDNTRSEAACYHDGKGLSQSEMKSCSDKDVKTIKVTPGDKLRLGVDRDVAKKGWFALLGQQQLQSKRTYLTADTSQLFTNPQTGQQLDSMDVHILESKDGNTVNGVWNFRLEKKDS